MDAQKARVVVADNHEAWLRVFCRILQRDFDIVGLAANAREASCRACELHPDVLIVDLGMLLADGLKSARLLVDSFLPARLIAVTVHPDADYAATAFSLGASGFILKSRANLDLPLAIAAAMEGQSFFSPGTESRG